MLANAKVHPSQLILDQTEDLLKKWKHPDPYRPPTAPGGSKYERNLPAPILDRKPSLVLSRIHTPLPHTPTPSNHFDILTLWYSSPTHAPLSENAVRRRPDKDGRPW